MAEMVGGFTFDEATHTYHVGRVEVPGTTAIIRHAGLFDPRWIPDSARDLGSELAWATEHWELGLIEDGDIEGKVRPLWLAYRAWCRAEGLTRYCEAQAKDRTWRAIEEPVVNRTLGLATIPDRVLGERTMLNLKKGNVYAFHPIQRALEVMAIETDESEWLTWERVTLYLKPTGRARPRVHEDDTDFEIALSALHDWKLAHA